MTDLEERIARHVYRAMELADARAAGLTISWKLRRSVEAEEHSRAVAQDILNDIKAQEKTDDQST